MMSLVTRVGEYEFREASPSYSEAFVEGREEREQDCDHVILAIEQVDAAMKIANGLEEEDCCVEGWKLLNKLGYDAGPPNGQIGEQTRNAIKSFERRNGLDETGEVNIPLVTKLERLTS